jgi:glycosyltransferase involved in cell wall biosynthesis
VDTHHRTALNKAIYEQNANLTATKSTQKVIVLVGTKNIIKNIFLAIFSKDIIILYFTGFGRLYTDFGVFGRLIFNIIVVISSLRRNRHFIVENSYDRRVVSQFSKRPITEINGSGFSGSRFRASQCKSSRPHGKVIGYMSRFGYSKCSDEVIKLISTLPPEYRIIGAGKDIAGNKYSHKFSELAKTNPQVEMIGHIETPEEVSSFFKKINVLLYPSLREGLPITLLEAAYHGVPFLTTNVAGCLDIANKFGFPTCTPEDFGKQKNHLDVSSWGSYSPRWQSILVEFSDQYVQKQFEKLLAEIIKTNQLDKF